MDATLEKTLISCWTEAARGAVSREETAEMVVPDTLPDIAEIIDADGVILIRGKEVIQGAVNVTAEILATVLFLPEGGGRLSRLSLKMPWNARLESAGLDEKCVPVASLTLCGIDARALNPRKILVRADVTAQMSCWRQTRLELPCGVQSEKSLETLMETRTISPVTAVREKTFAVVDEFDISSSRPAIGSILKYRVSLLTEDIKAVGSKLVFKGSAQTELLYAGVEYGEPVSAAFTSSFSQIIEMDALCEGGRSEVALLLTGAYIEQSSPGEQCRSIKAELHLAAQAVLRQDMESVFLSDAYCNSAQARLEREEVPVERVERELTLRENVRELMETPSPVHEVVSVYALVSPAEVRDDAVCCSVCVRAVYRTESGQLCAVSRTYPVKTALELSPGLRGCVRAVRCTEAYATPAAGGLEVRVPVDMLLAVCEPGTLTPVTSVTLEEDEGASAVRASVIVRSVSSEDSLWSLAKSCGSTVELICRVNALEGEELPTGRVLLIPRGR